MIGTLEQNLSIAYTYTQLSSSPLWQGHCITVCKVALICTELVSTLEFVVFVNCSYFPLKVILRVLELTEWLMYFCLSHEQQWFYFWQSDFAKSLTSVNLQTPTLSGKSDSDVSSWCMNYIFATMKGGRIRGGRKDAQQLHLRNFIYWQLVILLTKPTLAILVLSLVSFLLTFINNQV